MHLMVKEQVSVCISNETVAQHRLRLQKLQISEGSVQGYTAWKHYILQHGSITWHPLLSVQVHYNWLLMNKRNTTQPHMIMVVTLSAMGEVERNSLSMARHFTFYDTSECITYNHGIPGPSMQLYHCLNHFLNCPIPVISNLDLCIC